MVVETWRDEYSVDIDVIDEQHKKLLWLLNEVNERVQVSRDSLEDAVGRLVIYVRTHFAHEEKLMSLLGYPAYEPHKKEHDDLIRLAAELRESARNGDADKAGELIDRIRALLMEHIVHDDKRYGSFFNCRGVV